MRHWFTTICLALPLWLTGCANDLYFYPDRRDYEPQHPRPVPHEDVWIDSTDGLRLHGWFLKAQGEPRATVVFLHGNAQNLTAHVLYVDWLPAAGYNVLIVDYRGYGRSPGRPSRQGLFEDARAAWFYALSRQDVDPQKMILLGQSLGGATALSLAGREKLPGLRAVVAESAFSSFGGIGREKLLEIPGAGYLLWPFSPLIISGELSPAPVVDRISPVPLLLIHGSRDNIVRPSHSDRLYETAKPPKLLWKLEDGQHTEAFGRFRFTTAPRLLKFFDYALSGDPQQLDPQDQAALRHEMPPAPAPWRAPEIDAADRRTQHKKGR
ncbi:MAG: alpha/beta hydrolase [Pseudomonadota bacterium]